MALRKTKRAFNFLNLFGSGLSGLGFYLVNFYNHLAQCTRNIMHVVVDAGLNCKTF